jgi:NADPH-dependent 2,4-dienoyl-CoA reductase/sulfur reductase-like enzyme
MSSVVIVGAGLGALRAAESLRANGFDGTITVVGDEPHLPYSRPPLSKGALAAGVDVAALEFRRRPAVADVEWLLGTAVVGADLTARRLTLSDGAVLEFDGLVAATGIRSRVLPLPGPASGRLRLRTGEDAVRIREHLVSGAAVVVMGAGFIGCEVAATARTMGCDVNVVALDPEPMIRPLGPSIGAAMRRRHERRGVRFHLGHSIDEVHGEQRVESVGLSDGSELPVDVLVEAVGSVPNVAWLEGNALDLSDGVLVDHSMQVVGAPVPMVAVGDVARHPNALFGGPPRRVEHWAVPTDTGRRAGLTLATLLAGGKPDRTLFAVLPSFWSDQYQHQIQSFGMPGLAVDGVVVEGSADSPCIATYTDATGLVGVVGIDRTANLGPYRDELLARTPTSS